MAVLDKIAETIDSTRPRPDAEPRPFCLLMRWNDNNSDEGEYGYAGRHHSYDEAVAAARKEMFLLNNSPEDDEEEFDENGEPLPESIPEYEVIEAHDVNIWAAEEALAALKEARDALAGYACIQDPQNPSPWFRKQFGYVYEAIDKLECRKG